MDGVATGFHRQIHDAQGIQIARQRVFTQAEGLIRPLDMEGEAVRFGIDGDGADAHLGAGPHDAQADFATIGHQDFFQFGFGLHSDVSKDGPVVQRGVF